MKEYTYCIALGDAGIKCFVKAENKEQAISKFISHMKNSFGEQCDPDVKSVNIFGSYSRGEATENSDIDFHIDKTGSTKLKSMLDMGEFREDLVDVLQKNVDIVTSVSNDYYNQFFYKNLLHDEVNIYVAE